VEETIGAGLYPAVASFASLVLENMPQIESIANGFVEVLGVILSGLSAILNGAVTVATAIANNWSWIAPIIMGVVAAIIAYNAVLGIGWLTTAKDLVVKAAEAVATLAQAAATKAATLAQGGLNAAIAASPVTWLVMSILVLIGVITAVVRVTNLWGAQSTSVFGTICGLIAVVIAYFQNLFLVVGGIFSGIGSMAVATGQNVMTAFYNCISRVQSWFYNLLSSVITVISGIASALNSLPFVEFDYSGLTAAAEKYASKSAEAAGDVKEYTNLTDAFTSGYDKVAANAFSSGWASSAFASGAAIGDSVTNKIKSLYTAGSIDDYVASAGTGAGTGTDATASGLGDAADSLGSTAANTGTTAANTSQIADALAVSNELLQYLRDIAEREVINKFTTAEIKIEMNNNNTISGTDDLDGIIEQLEEKLTTAVVEVSEGVHV
jgi:hypothetical protein